MHSKNLRERFDEKVIKMGPDECWPWVGGTDVVGRGHFWDGHRLRVSPQVSWELAHGRDFPQGLFACHSCDNPNCVNPGHIWAGTRSENSIDAIKKGLGFIPVSPHKGKTHCKRGHELIGDNVRVGKDGRYCRECCRILSRASYHAKKLAATATLVILLSVPGAGCASSEILSLPQLEHRTLRISPDFAGFEYQYEVCVSKFIWCTKWEWRKDKYDLNDKAVREKLINMGFVARVRDQQ